MADTVEAIVRQIRGLCPLAPPLTVLDWVNDAYKRIAGGRPWSFLRGENAIQVVASRAGTASLLLGDATVTGIALVFASSDVGRQIRRSSELPYTIISVDTGANTAELDRTYSGVTSASVSLTILDAYVTMPEDFGRFIAVLDPSNQRQLLTGITEEEANYYDPARTMTGQPRALISRKYSPVAGFEGRVTFEMLPYSTAAANYPYYYVKTPGSLGLDDYLAGPLRARTDVLKKAAMVECCKWPGLGLTPDKVNPYARTSADRVNLMVAEVELEIAKLEARDEEIYMTWLEVIGISQFPFYSSPFVSADLRATDIGLIRS